MSKTETLLAEVSQKLAELTATVAALTEPASFTYHNTINVASDADAEAFARGFHKNIVRGE